MLSREDLMKPETCRGCHPKHYDEWAGSMHAYAAADPVFIAMNKRGQRETEGKMGDFCVRCHAPMAVREGATSDGLNLDTLPSELKGVTCYFCHAAVGHQGLSNNGVILKEDGVMRGPLKRAVDPVVHGVSYSTFHDPREGDSSLLCGSCHDVVNQKNVEIERTYKEFAASLFGRKESLSSCQVCHMEAAEEDEPIAEMPGRMFPKRKRHSHMWPAVDVALTDDFPDQERQRHAVECELINSLGGALLRADDPLGLGFTVTLETNAGHSQPSGAAQDRRMWIEAIGYDAQGKVLSRSGDIAEGEVEQPPGAASDDPSLTMLRDRMFDEQDHEVHMFWEAAHVKTRLLPATTILNVPHSIEAKYRNPVPVARFEVRIRMRPVGMDVLQSLVESKDLDPSVLSRMPTFTLGTATWTPADSLASLRITRRDLRCNAGLF